MGPIHAAHSQAGNSPSCPFNSGLGHGIFIGANLHKYKLIIRTKKNKNKRLKQYRIKKKKRNQGSRHQSQSHSSVPNVTLDRSHAPSASWFPCGKMKRFLKVYRHRRASDITVPSRRADKNQDNH